MSPADKLFPLLTKLRKTKQQTWQACCPAHDDKTPSMHVTEAEDGRLLLKCWAGCTAAQIVGAVGLELRDLFVSDPSKPRRRGPSQKAIDHERLICRLGDAQRARNEPMNAQDLARYELARQRLGLVDG